MKVQYFTSTDTLYIEFRLGDIVESRDLDENTVIDMDAEGNVTDLTPGEQEKASMVIWSEDKKSLYLITNTMVAIGLSFLFY